MIFISDPMFNEPGYEAIRSTPEGNVRTLTAYKNTFVLFLQNGFYLPPLSRNVATSTMLISRCTPSDTPCWSSSATHLEVHVYTASTSYTIVAPLEVLALLITAPLEVLALLKHPLEVLALLKHPLEVLALLKHPLEVLALLKHPLEVLALL